MTDTTVTLDGHSLTIAQVVSIARGDARVELADTARDAMNASRALKQELIELEKPIYGVTTGFGDSADRQIAPAKAAALQKNLIRYHVNGTGPTASLDTVLATMVIRANCLARGASAVNPAVVDRLVQMINERVVPVIPERGSVGASGDLVPLCYLACAVDGDALVRWQGEELEMSEVQQRLGWESFELEAKDGLAMINGTSFSSGFAVLAVADAERLAGIAEAGTAMASEGLLGNRGHFAPFLFEAKPHPGQARAAATIYDHLADSSLAMEHSQVLELSEDLEGRAFQKLTRSVQDRYSIRCAPHVLGVLRDTLSWVTQWVEREINSSNDNPLFSVADHDVFSGGNFYGGHVTQSMDSLKAAVANVADLLDRQVALLVDERFSNGLPTNLAPLAVGDPAQAGLHHGFKGMQLACSAVTAEALKSTMPASVFSRSTESHNQDKVSMSAMASRDARTTVGLVEEVCAIHLLTVCQAVDLRDGAQASSRTRAVLAQVRGESAFVEQDRKLQADIDAVLRMIRAGQLSSTLQGAGHE